MHKGCFFLHKQYYSPELVSLLIKEYSEKANKKVGDSHIWDFSPNFKGIMSALKNPNQTVKQIKSDYMTEWERKNEVF
jgi:hypothetical protein